VETKGTPNKYDPHFVWGWIYDDMEKLNNFNISPASVKIALFNSLSVDFKSDHYSGILENVPLASKKDIMEYVYYIYVDQDVTVSADKTNYTEQHLGGVVGEPPTVFYTNYTVDAFNHSLKAGWNIVYVRSIFEGNNTYKETFLHANPNNWNWTLSMLEIF